MPSSRKRKALCSPHKENKMSISKRKKDSVASTEPVKKKRRSLGARGESKSCHQCRQSIFSSKGISEAKQGEMRIKCGNCTRFWCGKCLQNRYGLDILVLDLTWSCAVCEKNCNCSICRKKEGKLATGILTPHAKTAGFTSVSEFLHKGEDKVAQCLQWKSPEVVMETTWRADELSQAIKKASASQRTERKNGRKRSHDGQLVKGTGEHHGRSVASLNGSESCVVPGNGDASQSLEHSLYSISVQEGGYGDTRTKPHKGLPHQQPIEITDSKRVCLRRSLRNRTLHTVPGREECVVTSRRKNRMRCDTHKGDHAPSDISKKREELSQLKASHVKSERKRIAEMKKRMRLDAAEERRAMKEKMKQEKQQLRDKLRKARSLVEEAQRIKRAKEKEMRRRELQLLMAQKREEKRKRKLLTGLALPTSSRATISSALEDDPAACKVNGVPDLPSLLHCDIDLPRNVLPKFLCVCEFLHTFREPLKLKKSMTKDLLVAALTSGRAMADLCWSLLQALASETDQLKEELKGFNRRNSLQILQNRFGKNGVVIDPSIPTVEEGVLLLDELCNELLSTRLVAGYIESAGREEEELKRSERSLELEKTKTMKQELKQLSEAGGSCDQLEKMREQFIAELEELKTKNKQQMHTLATRVRVCPLGQDRHDRYYWKLQSCQDTILVEDSDWKMINTQSDLSSLKKSLFVNGRREGLLVNELAKLTLLSLN